MSRRFAYIVLFLVGWICSMTAQNPFEMRNRTTQQNIPSQAITTASDSTTLDSLPKNVQAGNPFDVTHIGQSRTGQNQSAKPEKTSTFWKDTFQSISSVKWSGNPQNFIFWVIFLILILLTLLLSVNRAFLGRVFQAFFNDNVLRQLHRELASVNSIIYFLMYSMFVLNVGILAFLLLRHFGGVDPSRQFTMLIYCILGGFGVFGIKHLLLTFIGAIFPIHKMTNLYQFTMVVFGINLGLFLVIANIGIAYLPTQYTIYCIYLMAFGTLIVYLLRTFRSLFILGGNLLLYQFHFFIYLCAVEIAPLAILIKSIMLQTA